MSEKLEITFHTALGEADETKVDQWELKAARRALANFKHLLTPKQIDELIDGQKKENDRRIRQYLEESNGEFKEVFVEVDVKGISATEYFNWQAEKMRLAMTGTNEERQDILENVIYPAHPEHYELLPSGVVETLGGLPTNAGLVITKEPKSFVLERTDDTFPHKSFGEIQLSDGKPWAYGVTEYKDIEDGAKFRLHVWWPTAAPQIFFDDHAQHFAIEYRIFLHMAYNDIKASKKAE